MPTIINADTSDGLKLTSDTSGEIELQSAGTEVVTIKSTGLDASATGIYLGGTASANLITDYETGTYTVQGKDESGNDSSTTVNGYYTKIGNMCYVYFRYENISTTGLTSGDAFQVTLPFAAANTVSQQTPIGNTTFVTDNAANDVVSASLNTLTNQALANFSFSQVSGGNDTITVGNLSSGASDIRTTFCYQTT